MNRGFRREQSRKEREQSLLTFPNSKLLISLIKPTCIKTTRGIRNKSNHKTKKTTSMVEYPNSITSCAINQCIPFPWKLHEMLETAEKEGFDSIVSWLPDTPGSFRVHEPDYFFSAVMPRYFKQTKYKSFQRQLNIYGFERILFGPGRGGYQHTFFVRGKPSLCRHMIRVKIKRSGTFTKPADSSESRAKTQNLKAKKSKSFTNLEPAPPPMQSSCFSQSNDYIIEANSPKFDEFKYVLLGFSLGCLDSR
jgi:hypothetical protein